MLSAPPINELASRPEIIHPPIDIPPVTVMTGLQGMGKSTVARTIAKLGNASYLSTDAIRLKLGLTFETGSLYPEEAMRLVYETMYYYAQLELEQDRKVVLDGTFGANRRTMFEPLVSQAHRCFVHVTVSDPELHRQRMLAREEHARMHGYVVAKYETYLISKDYYTPPEPGPQSRSIFNDYHLGAGISQMERNQVYYAMLSPHFNEAELIFSS